MPNKPRQNGPRATKQRQSDGTGILAEPQIGKDAWEILFKLGAQPDALAAVCPHLSEVQADAELRKARSRVEEAERQKREHLRNAVPVRETPDQKIVADALRSGLTCPSGPG